MRLKNADEALRGNKDFVISCLRTDGLSLRYASADLRADLDVVRVALQQDSLSLRYAAKELRENRTLVADVVKKCGIALEHTVLELRKDRELVLEAVRQDGTALAHAGKDLRKDREVVLAAVAECGLALEHARSALRDDRSIVLEAVRRHGGALHFASEELRGDREVCCTACRNDPDAVEAVATEDVEVLRLAKLASLQGVQERLRGDWDAQRRLEEEDRRLRDEAEEQAKQLRARLDKKAAKKAKEEPKEPAAPPSLKQTQLVERINAWADQAVAGGKLYRKIEAYREQNLPEIIAKGTWDFGDPWERKAPKRLPPAPAPKAVAAPVAGAPQSAAAQRAVSVQSVTVYSGPDPGIVRSHIISKAQALVSGDDIDGDTPLMESGIDSIASVELRTTLQQDFSLPLPSTLMFNYPTITMMTEFLVDEITKNKVPGWGTETVVQQTVMVDVPEVAPVAAPPPVEQQVVTYQPPDPEMVRGHIVMLVQNMTGGDTLEGDTPFMESGIDSIASVELRNSLSKDFNMELASSVMFNYPTLTTMTDYLVDQMTQKQITFAPK